MVNYFSYLAHTTCHCFIIIIIWRVQALYSAMDEEDTLAHELEQEHEEALEAAILAEETWLEELAREQSREIQVDTEPDTEQEELSLAVSLISN